MITRRGRLTAAVALAVVTMTSCGADKQEAVPTTTTTPPPRTTTRTTTPPPSAPAVANPLDASEFEANPCASLTDAQKSQYGITHAERSTLATEGESCFFYRTNARPFWVAYASRVPSGLSSLYRDHARGTWGYWQPAELEGYPALAFGNTNPPACFFAVSVSDSLYFWVSTTTDETCAESKPVASTVLANIKAAN